MISNVGDTENRNLRRFSLNFSEFNSKDLMDLTFSLVDYKNNYLISSDRAHVISFYESFENPAQLIEWMVERPKGNFRIIEINGDKDKIVVIPTIDYNGKFAKNCRNRIFKGMHIIFVESGYGNSYFNYAYNCNAGIKRALEYDPTWIILSNDDMIEMDKPEYLIESLNKVFPKINTVVFSQNRLNVGNLVKFGITTLRRNLFMKLVNEYTRAILKFERKFNIEFLVEGNRFPLKYMTKHKYSYRAISDFSIFSADILRAHYPLYDENFVNGGEDILASIKLYVGSVKYKIIDYSIDSIGGASIGTKGRMLKDISNMAYLNYKILPLLNIDSQK